MIKMSYRIKVLVFSLLFFLSLLPSQSAYAITYHPIRIVTTNTYNRLYPTSGNNYANTKIEDLNFSFAYFGLVFNVADFTKNTYNDFPADFCPLALNSYCTSSCATYLSDRHKNYLKNLQWLQSEYSYRSTNFIITMQGSVFDGGVLGVAELNGNRSVVAFSQNTTTTVDSRVLQHEVSHFFGISDGGCNGRCIMSGGYDAIPVSSGRNV